MQEKRCKKSDLDTPCLVVDLDLMERNIKIAHDLARSHDKNVRPHAKTHKCSAIARKQVEAGAIGACVAKMSEADVLVAAGVKGILMTSPLATAQKMERFAGILKRDPDVMVVVDHSDGARRLNDVLARHGLKAGVLIDLDVGLQRTGIPPGQALSLAGDLAGSSSLDLKGVQAYAGQVQHVASFEERQKSSLECMGRAAAVYRELKAAGFPCDVFSGGGTGTHDIDINIPELTELQLGSYVLMDSEYAAIGTPAGLELFDAMKPALTLLTSVVSVSHEAFVTVDTGLKTLYRHGGIPRVLKPKHPGLSYDWFGDEFGKILVEQGAKQPALGSVLELMVSHCDPTVNLFDQLYVTRKEKVVDVWPIDMRGCSQ